MNTRPAFFSAALCCALLTACSRIPSLDANRITADTRVLASDEFAGRAPVSEGEQKTLAYLVQQLEAAGLKPGGDLKPDGSRAWTQDVPLLRTEIDGPVTVAVQAGRDQLSWTQGEQVAIRAAQTGAERVVLKNAPLVFVGYGVHAPERNWDDFKGIDLKGKVAVFLVNDPDFDTATSDFGGKAMTYYGRWTYKYEEAARRGAAGALVIHETDAASYGWPTVKNSNTGEMFDVLRADPLAAHVLVEGWIQRDIASDLFRRAGLDFEALKNRAHTREFNPVILPGTRISIEFAVKKEQVTSKNVMAVLPGDEYPDEWVLYTAHWDHLGVIPDPKGGDAIYNGALDNAAGCAQVLEIARTFAKARHTKRSLGFLFVTAEEKGLLGSEYYATNPLYPLAKTVAVLNTDAPRSAAGPMKDFSTAGDVPSTLQDQLIEAGGKFGWSYSPDPRPEAGSFYRSDHFSFAKRGVPAISYKSGQDLKDGGVEAGKAWADAYNDKRYHQPSDEIGDDWRSDGIAADGALLYVLGRQLADSHRWPEWKPSAEVQGRARCVGGAAPVTFALIALGIVACALLLLALYLLWRPNPLQQRTEELLEERSRLSASLEHAKAQLLSERETALGQLQKQEQWIREQTQLFEARVLAATSKLMEDSGRALSERNQKDVTAVVAPFKEQLAEFRQRVDHIYAADTHERGTLKAQIETLTSMNQAMSVQAQRLTNALTVTSKSVGDWGETILEKILEDSGLRRGHEYELQVSIAGRQGEALRPDALIRLPESRQLVVDSKVSNKAWSEYCAAVDEVEKEARLREHLASLRAHMKSLSGKGYTDAPELSTVDFVLMFVPVEAALLTAFVKDPNLYADAYRSRIVLVTPSTLMAVIKLVEGIWVFQKRKESADEIAEHGRKLYEKLTNFAQSFVNVGRAISQSSEAFEQAKGQLSTGKGNAIKLAENLKALGVTPAAGKQMPAQLLLPNQDEDE